MRCHGLLAGARVWITRSSRQRQLVHLFESGNSGGGGAMSSERSELIATISACADALHGLAIDGLDGREAAEQLLALDALAGRFTALSARLVPAVEADGWWAVSGARSIASWLSTA